MYERLEKFYKIHGHSAVPEYWKEDPQLAIWVSYQRRAKKPLSKEKIYLLDKLEFLWNPKKGRPRRRNEAGQYAKEA